MQKNLLNTRLLNRPILLPKKFSYSPFRCAFMRHGESVWNLENRYTGWADVPLTEKGQLDADMAGRLLRDFGCQFDIVYTSVLGRALHTYKILSNYIDSRLPVVHSYKLNTIHYGALEGLEKSQAQLIFGPEKIECWKSSFDISPPALSETDPRHPKWDPKYQGIPKSELPATESLKDIQTRVLSYWFDVICPAIREGKTPLVVCHETTLRVIFGFLDGIKDLRSFKVPNASPIVYEFDQEVKPLKKIHLKPNVSQIFNINYPSLYALSEHPGFTPMV